MKKEGWLREKLDCKYANCYYMSGKWQLFSGYIQNEKSGSEQTSEQLRFKTDVQAKSWQDWLRCWEEWRW